MATAIADLERRDFSPDTTVIAYMRKQNLSWHIVLKELIDNAIDASATTVWPSGIRIRSATMRPIASVEPPVA